MTGEAPLVIRADASGRMGTGHAMRCLALAQAWQDAGGRAVFAMANSTPAVRERLLSEACEMRPISGEAGAQEDSRQTIGLARGQEAEWVVVDGYQFSADYQRALKAAGCKVLFVDDYGHAGHYSADVLLNQNAHAKEGMYWSRESYTRLLLGPGYSMLRREFDSWRGWKRELAPVGRKILVTMGGSDPENFTGIVVEGLRRLPSLEVMVVVGGSNPHLGSLEQATLQDASWLQLRRGMLNMPELMAWADVAVSAAGSTCWEMCMLGLPAILIDLADNQTPVARELASRQVAIHVGSSKSVRAEDVTREMEDLLPSPATRASMSRRGQELVDGGGASRVVAEIRRRG